jgi:DNA-binding NarL/FixJ family response regulator
MDESRGAGAAARLSARERQVAALIATGLSNPEIADRLDIAPKTVSAHVSHILTKLGFRRRTEVAAWAALEGLVGMTVDGRLAPRR